MLQRKHSRDLFEHLLRSIREGAFTFENFGASIHQAGRVITTEKSRGVPEVRMVFPHEDENGEGSKFGCIEVRRCSFMCIFHRWSPA